MCAVKKKAYGKINLFLDIEERRNDGYHNIMSVMQTVDWCDTVSVSKNNDPEIKVISSNSGIPCDSSNIAYKVAKVFFEKLGIAPAVTIEIEKNIPIAAGMAGGSADGAATLEALNELFDSPFSQKDLILMSQNIGADIPFCLVKGTKLISGIGEIIENIEGSFPECFILCAKPNNVNISTPAAYRELDSVYRNFVGYSYEKNKLENLLMGIREENIEKITASMYNIFEKTQSAIDADVATIKSTMLKYGALGAMMSGSGPSVFGIFSDEAKANSACEFFKRNNIIARSCRPTTK
ncbi:MAG: 4-(cytidine 5'-diphospho)-2-C-methyl-D-erythritol kinase [Clostridia bacterium]|nr:4-(cytidine 5'-diphospho)-2-C-methyl-D-erythritol kinase [Clostridia bacterium]